MNMQRFSVSVLFIAAVFVPGCKKKAAEKAPEPAPKVEPGSAAVVPAAPPSAGCAAGATKVEELGFCITLPAGYKVGKADNGLVTLESAETKMKDIDVSTKDGTLADVPNYDMFVNDKKNTVKGSGELLGGKGKWFYVTPNGEKGYTTGVYVQGNKKVFICERAGSDDSPDAAALLEICKTITPI